MGVKLMGSRKNSRLIMIVVIAVLGLAVLIMPVYGLYRFRIINHEHEDEIQGMQTKLDEWRQKVEQVDQLKMTVYVPKENISIFSIINKDMLNKVDIYTSVPQEYYLSDNDFGMMTTTELLKGLPVMRDVLVDEKINNDIRENEFNMFLLPSNLNKNEIVDVRITFPNGEDYIVLTKKKIYGLSYQKNTIWIWLSEKELHRINSAIIDAYMNPGTKLYVLKYVQPETQDGIISTYIVNEHVMDVMKTSPNKLQLAKEELALQVRKLLEERLNALPSESVSAVESSINADANTRRIVDVNEENQDKKTAENVGSDNVQNDPAEDSNSSTDNEDAKLTQDQEGSSVNDGFY